MSRPDDVVAVLDANVLYRQWLRDVMLTLAAMGYYQPRWSRQIIEEMRCNVLADPPNTDPRRFNATTIAALRSAFPEAWIDPSDALIATMDNAPGDHHVLAAAVAGDAHLVVTANLADFPSPRFVESGRLAVESPTDYPITVLNDHPDLMATAPLHLATHRRGVATVTDVLDQLSRNQALQPFIHQARRKLL